MIIYDNVNLYPNGSEIVMGKEYKKNRRGAYQSFRYKAFRHKSFY